MPSHTKWTPEMDAQLTAMSPDYICPQIAKEMGLSHDIVWRRFKKLGIIPKTTRALYEPPADLWVQIATQTAHNHRVSPSHLLAGRCARKIVAARQQAWGRLLADHPQYSISGLGRTSGFSRATIIQGLRKLRAMGCH